MYFGADALERLIKRDKDIVGAPYNTKSDPPLATHKIQDKETIIEELEGDLLKCTGVATGFMLIKTEVFKKLEHPWFMFETDIGEDLYFCRKARQAGYDIWCDLSIKIGHIGETIF